MKGLTVGSGYVLLSAAVEAETVDTAAASREAAAAASIARRGVGAGRVSGAVAARRGMIRGPPPRIREVLDSPR